MNYEPNFRDPRVKKRILRALGFACSSLSIDKSRAWARVELDRHFGTQNHKLSKWLRSKLLVKQSDKYNMDRHLCKQYTLNSEGVCELSELYNVVTKSKFPSVAQVQELVQKTGIEWAREQYLPQIQSGLFEYKDKSHRLWNDIQRLPTDIRRPLFAQQGYHWEYDICASAPTLIYQRARREGMTRPTKTLDAFLQDRQLYRQALAETLDCDLAQAKQIITALFSGAKLGPGNAIADVLNHDMHKLQILKNNTWIKELRKDIKKCWDAIKSSESSLRLRSRDKWMIYFELERSVMTVVRTELTKLSVRYFLEHDGWRCDSHIDEYSLRLLVKKKTGYSVEFDCVRIIY
jgi:hypothetical protein